MVSVGSVRCLVGVNLLRLQPRRVGWTQAWGSVHAWTFSLWGARLSVVCLVRRYTLAVVCLVVTFIALRSFIVAILYIAFRVHDGREGRDGVVGAGGAGWCWQAVGK